MDLKGLKGVDDVLRNLEINIVLPLENDELATRFRLRSKRGVLLSGPHGTGKTTVGRALTVCWVANWQSDERSEKAARADCQSALRRSAAKLQVSNLRQSRRLVIPLLSRNCTILRCGSVYLLD